MGILKFLNYFILLGIFYALATSLFHNNRVLSGLFLIGFTQIGNIFPALGSIRFELLVGCFSLLFLILNLDRLSHLSPTSNPVAKYFYLFLTVCILSIPFSVSPPESMYWLEYYFKRCWVYFFLAVVLLKDEKTLREFFTFYLIGISWLSLCAFVNYLTGVNVGEVQGVVRVRGETGILSNPNGMANTIIQAIPIIYFYFQYYQTKLSRYILFSLGGVFLLSILFSGSRGGFYGLVITSFILALFSQRKKLALGIAAIGFIAVLVLIGPELLERYATILNPSNLGRSGNDRILGLMHGFSMLIRRPLLGVGLGCYPVARGDWFNFRFWAHNHYGQLIGELGLLGIFTWGMMIFHTIWGARKVRETLKQRLPHAESSYLYILCLAIETSTYSRLILGMTTHSMHIFFWYLNAGIIAAIINYVPSYLNQKATQPEAR